MKFIKKNKGLLIILGLILVLILIMILIFGRMFIKSGASTYGNRLDGIVKVTAKDNEKVVIGLKEHDEVSNVSVRIQGKILYINISYKKGTSVSKAKEIANSVVGMYSEEILNDYDLGLFLTEEDDDNEETEEFAITGTKHPEMEGISYIKS